MKKLISILLVLVMIWAISISVFAADGQNVTLTITGAEGHTYKLYQIFVGDVDQEGDKTVLSNVKYGAHYHPEGQQDKEVPKDVLNTIASSDDPEDLLDAALRESDLVATPEEGESTVVFENLAPGYYLVKDVSADLDGETKSPIMLQILKNVSIASKHASIVSEKKVADKNDSLAPEEDDRDWKDVADYDFGDMIPFRLSVTLPSTLEHYDTYELVFHDSKAAGLGEAEEFEVYIERIVDGTAEKIIEITSGYTYDPHPCGKTTCDFLNNCSFTVTVNDVVAYYKNDPNVTFANGDKLVVEYKAELLDTANVGSAGNVNSMFVHHPDGHTAVDSVTVLTYALTVNKIIGGVETRELLPGAGFTLRKWIEEDEEWIDIGDEIVGDEENPLTKFVWRGLDGGKYKLVETTRPKGGYNTMPDLIFVINATHAETWLGNNSALWNLIARDVNNTKNVFADIDENGFEDGMLEGDVENYKGIVLPETGAEGTKWFIFGGAILVLFASVFMITRKKMSVYED